MMKNKMKVSLVAFIMVCSTSISFGYEVWMGTHLATHTMATNLSTWSMAASRLDGFNINRTPHDTDPATNNDWRTIFAQFTNAGTTISELARVTVSKNPEIVDELAFSAIDYWLDRIFGFESTYGYRLDILMFYDEAGTYNGIEYNYNWTVIEVQHMREWLDTHGRASVELMYDARNNSQANRDWCVHPLVDHIMIEASTTELLGNQHSQITLLQWLWTNPATINKKVVLQIPRTENSISQYAGTRRVAQMLGTKLGYGEDGVRSDRLVFLPVTYNDNFPYIPETVSNGTQYTNTLTSICLSLLEQRDIFEGRTRIPTIADADSFDRYLESLILHYPLDGNTQDSSGNNYHGTLTGGVFAPSLVEHDQGLVLDGIDDYVAVPGYKGVLGGSSRTCSAWIKTAGSVNNMVITSWGTIAAGGQWLLGVFNTGELALYSGGPYIKAAATIADNRWHHVAAVLDNDGSPNINEIKLYIDGRLRTDTYVTGSQAINTVQANPAQVGCLDNAGVPTAFFKGQMDDVRIYNYALTAEDIVSLAAIARPSIDIVADNIINTYDFLALADKWLDADCFSSNLCDGRDLNADQQVNLLDMSILSHKWLTSVVWASQDIGAVAAAGSAVENAGTITIQGSGSDIWLTVDEFHYYYRNFSGDGQIVAKVVSQTNTNAWAKAGVMIRETLNADSKHASMVITPGQGSSFQRRLNTADVSYETTQAGLAAPAWVKLIRMGNTFTGYSSANGTSWTQIGTATISMSADVYIGLCVTSHNDGVIGTATITDVAIQ